MSSYEQKFISFKEFRKLEFRNETWFYEYKQGIGFRNAGFLYFIEINSILSELTFTTGVLWSSEVLKFYPLYFNRKWHFYIHVNYKGDGHHNRDVDDDVYFDLSRREYLEKAEFEIIYKKYIAPFCKYNISKDLVIACSINPNVKYYPFGEEDTIEDANASPF